MVGCLLISSFPLACELADHEELRGSPCAVIDENSRVEAVSVAAEAYGVHPGQTAREAIGRCPGLAALETRPARYDLIREEIRVAVDEVAFTVEAASAGVIYVAVDELLTCYRTLDAAIKALLGCAPQTLEPRVGVAPTRFTAMLAARQARANGSDVVGQEELSAFLAPQPVQALPVSVETLRRLRVLGLQTLDELRALPRSALAAQFGPEGDLAWQLASGTDCEPLRPQRRCVQLVEQLSLETPLSGRQPLLVAWEQTLSRLLRQRGFHGLAARQAELRAATERGRQWSRVVTFKEPLADFRQMWSPLRAALDEALFPGPLSELSIELRGLGPAQGHQLALPSARSTMRSRLEEGLRQLKARYGYCPVGRVVEVEPWNRIPERRLALIDFDP
jgi:DNA polymerase-4/protein ImuB